jgi:hypothetical protein
MWFAHARKLNSCLRAKRSCRRKRQGFDSFIKKGGAATASPFLFARGA